MNPETPMTPREELEMRVTALLMGELPPEEAQLLEAQIAADADLRKLHERLRHAVELLREASAMPEQPAPEVPVRLSEERRQRLLEHFKVVTPLPSLPSVARAARPRRDWKWIVPLGLAASLIALLGGAVWMDVFPGRRLGSTAAPDFDSDGLEYSTGDAAGRRSFDWSGQSVPAPTGRERDAKTQAGASAGNESRWFFPASKAPTQQLADNTVNTPPTQLDGEAKMEAVSAESLGRALAENTPAEGKKWGRQPGAVRLLAPEAEAAPPAPAAQPPAGATLYAGTNPAPPPPAPAPVTASSPLPVELTAAIAPAPAPVLSPAKPGQHLIASSHVEFPVPKNTPAEPTQKMDLFDLPEIKSDVVTEPYSVAGKVTPAIPLTPFLETGKTVLRSGIGGGRDGALAGPQSASGQAPAPVQLFAKGKEPVAESKASVALTAPSDPNALTFSANIAAGRDVHPGDWDRNLSKHMDGAGSPIEDRMSDLLKAQLELAESKQVIETLAQRAKASEDALASTKRATDKYQYGTVKNGPAGTPSAANSQLRRKLKAAAGEVTAKAAESDFGTMPQSGVRTKIASGGLGGLPAGVTLATGEAAGVADAPGQATLGGFERKLAEHDAIKDSGAVAANGMFGFGEAKDRVEFKDAETAPENGVQRGAHIQGNTRTKDSVPRREVLVPPGAKPSGAEAGGQVAAADSKKQHIYIKSLQHADVDNVAETLRGMLGEQSAQQKSDMLGDIPLQKGLAESLSKSRTAGAAQGLGAAVPAKPAATVPREADVALGFDGGSVPKAVEFDGFITDSGPVQSTTKGMLGQSVTEEKPAMFDSLGRGDVAKEADASGAKTGPQPGASGQKGVIFENRTGILEPYADTSYNLYETDSLRDKRVLKLDVDMPQQKESLARYRGLGVPGKVTVQPAQRAPAEPGMVAAGDVAEDAEAMPKDAAGKQILTNGRNYEDSNGLAPQNQSAQEKGKSGSSRMLLGLNKEGSNPARKFGNTPAPAAQPTEAAKQERPALKQDDEKQLAEIDAIVPNTESVTDSRTPKAEKKTQREISENRRTKGVASSLGTFPVTPTTPTKKIESKTSFFGDIPLIGKLFRSNSKAVVDPDHPTANPVGDELAAAKESNKKPDLNEPVTAGNRSGTFALSANANDALVLGVPNAPQTPATTGVAPAPQPEKNAAGSEAKNPAPVKWLYVLHDGSIGPESLATEANPVVGRTAFWADDDTVKLNINTQSEGTYWLDANGAPLTWQSKVGEVLQSNTDQVQTAQTLINMYPWLPPEGQTETVQHIAKLLPEQEYAKVLPAELRAKVKEVRDEDEARTPRPAPPADEPQPEIATSANAFSTFSLNVSDVSFKLAGGSLEQGKMPEPGTIRSEEFINALDYRDPEPAPGAPLAFASERARYPFAQNRDLLRFAVKTAAAGRQPGRPLNIVLLLDNSGSMERADRVHIVREALRVLAAQLQPQDQLSVVTFARTPRLWIDGVSGDKAGEATERVTEITPQGGTNIEAALDLGYATALRHYQTGSINRVVMLTDGAANLGDVDPDALKKKVEAHRKEGIALDCFGVGWEGYDDTLLEALSRHGDGRYGFINTPEEAATGFAGQLAGALHVAAADVKVQVEFNPRRVTSYRQIGYAKHQLTKEQFRDNTVDAAEIGAAESGNALYVVEVNPGGEGDLATVHVRFKVPGTSDYKEHEWAVPFTPNAPPLEQASPALRLAGTASAFSEWLTASPYAAEVTPDRLLGLINGVPAIYGADPRPQRLEWMIRQAKNISGK